MLLLISLALAGFPDLDGDGYESTVDCNDADADINPGAAEVFYDGVDQNCDGKSDYDRDGDRFDERASTAGRAACPLLPGGAIDWASVDPVVGCGVGLDCDDGAMGVAAYPGAVEACELGAQVDNDCDGSVNTARACSAAGAPSGYSVDASTTCGASGYFVDRTDSLDYLPVLLGDPAVLAEATQRYTDFAWDPAWAPPPNVSVSRFYPDADGDGWGDDDLQGVRLCDVGAEVRSWQTGRGDCDDAVAAVNPEGLELCDATDNNCNYIVDEADLALTPADDPTCVWHSADQDGDGYGGVDSEAFCLCDGFERYDVDGVTGAVTPVPEPQVCVNAEGDYGHRIAGECFLRDASDCDDLDANKNPASAERLDGADSDCDGRLALIELDCDGDGAPAIPHLASAALQADRANVILSAAELGLATCVGAAAPDFTCGDANLTLTCDEATGLWLVDEVEVATAGLTPALEDDAWDCDDSCAARRTETAETCDGIDNDCDQWLESAVAGSARFAADVDGVPDTHGATIGTVAATEADDDGDGLITCDSLLDQTAEVAPTCTALTVGEPEEPRACGCDTTAPTAPAGLALLGLALLRRRRR